jgi:hypothetical protein
VTENAAEALDRLEGERATGRLTVRRPDGGVARLYMRNGRVFHAEGPAGEGDAALSQALGWWDAGTVFSAKARLPETETIGVGPMLELPAEWPEDDPVRKDEMREGIEQELKAMRNRAIVTLVGLALLAAAIVFVLSLK